VCCVGKNKTLKIKTNHIFLMKILIRVRVQRVLSLQWQVGIALDSIRYTPPPSTPLPDTVKYAEIQSNKISCHMPCAVYRALSRSPPLPPSQTRLSIAERYKKRRPPSYTHTVRISNRGEAFHGSEKTSL
jgi:hypothetical protein